MSDYRRKPPEEEPLLPPWVFAVAVRLGPAIVLIGAWWLLSSVLHVPAKVLAPAMAALILGSLVFFGGRYYRTFRADRKSGKCLARGADERRTCRMYMPGAKLGGGCGRIMENGRCRVLRG